MNTWNKNDNSYNHNNSSWKNELLFHLLLSADHQIDYFQSSSQEGSAIITDLHSLFHQLTNQQVITEHDRLMMIYILAIILNKAKMSPLIHLFLFLVFQQFQQFRENSKNSEGNSMDFVIFYVWMTKALILRSPLTFSSPINIQLIDYQGNTITNFQSWQDVFFQSLMSYFVETSNNSIISIASKLFPILLIPIEEQSQQSQQSQQSSSLVDSISSGAVGLSADELIGRNLFNKTNRGNYQLFYYQKLFQQLLPVFTFIMKATPAAAESSSLSSSSSSSLVLMGKVPMYIFFCQLIVFVPQSIRKLHLSFLFDGLMTILSICNQQEKQSIALASNNQQLLASLERELFPAIELLLKESPALFYESLHLIVPRLIKVNYSDS
jgi:hypothetical protein